MGNFIVAWVEGGYNKSNISKNSTISIKWRYELVSTIFNNKVTVRKCKGKQIRTPKSMGM